MKESGAAYQESGAGSQEPGGGALYHLEDKQWSRVRKVILVAAIASWAAVAAGLVTDRAHFFPAWLTGLMYFITIGLGALFFVMLQHLTGAAWSVTVRRLMENIMVTIPAAAVLFIPVVLGLRDLYKWTDSKNGYLTPRFFLIRAAAYFAVWSFFAWKLHRASTAQDEAAGKGARASRWSAPGVILLFLTGTLASFDWIMSLDSHWYSTIFGVYVLSGGAWAFFALLILICLALRRAGILKDAITVEHYHDLGKWLFAFTVFWAYIAFSQYLLIWYANIPEETVWFRHRLEGGWRFFSATLLFGHFLLPFLVLLPRAAKRNLKVLGATSGFVLLMHFVDIYWLIMPALQEQGPAFHWIELAAPVAIGSTLALVFWAKMRSAAIAAVGDPRFGQGLEFQNV